MAGGGKGDRAGINTSYVKKIMAEQLYIHLNTAAVARASEGRREREREKERERERERRERDGDRGGGKWS